MQCIAILYAVLTESGRASLQRAWPGHWRGIHQHFIRHLDQKDIEALYSALSKVLEAEMGEGIEISSVYIPASALAEQSPNS